MKAIIIFISQVLIVLFLTLISQVGGLIYLVTIWVDNQWKYRFRFKRLLIFLCLYIVSIFTVVPFVAKKLGRVQVTHHAKIKVTNYMTVLLNRNYVVPSLNNLLMKTVSDLQETDIEIHYLDANFPFVNGFPLLPHKSHNDGKKIDLSLIYQLPTGEISIKQKSRSGYGFYEVAKEHEKNQTNTCLSKGYWQYDFPKYLTLGSINQALVFSETGTKKLITSILKNKNVGKIFIEPHLKDRMKLVNPKIRFHGCGAVRHDDHIHVQLK